jgi:hypothetical protein
MGLDQFAYRIKKGVVTEDVDFSTEKYNEETLDYDVVVDKTEIHYWRKHPAMQGWMKELYESKGGEEPSFNCVNVKVSEEDLLELQRDIKNDSLASRFEGGFFFGEEKSNELKDDDLEFISKGLESYSKGYEIYYSSWW